MNFLWKLFLGSLGIPGYSSEVKIFPRSACLVAILAIATLIPPASVAGVVKKNSTFSQTLQEEGISPSEIHAIVGAMREHLDLRRINAGTRYEVVRELGPVRVLRSLRLELSLIKSLTVSKESGAQWRAEMLTRETGMRVATYAGRVDSSLWDSAIQAGMDPQLIVELAEVFAWQVDFAREVRQGDEWRFTVEERLVEGKPAGWGKILAAEYRNQGELHTAILFRRDGQDLGYFAPDGSSMRKMFLKSPLRYGRISSRFTMKRFHPVLGINRPHLGVDYAAPVGTPIRAVGDGTVMSAGYRGGGGKTIILRHNSVYKTSYKHLSGFAKTVRAGARVRQGDVIGYVGSTGLSTGPHLHFEFFQNGTFINPLGKKFPSADPVSKELMPEFEQLTAQARESLPPWFQPGVSRIGARQVASVVDER